MRVGSIPVRVMKGGWASLGCAALRGGAGRCSHTPVALEITLWGEPLVA